MENILPFKKPQSTNLVGEYNLDKEQIATMEHLCEQMVIQSLLGLPDSLDGTSIGPVCFNNPHFRRIYCMIAELRKKGVPIEKKIIHSSYIDDFQDAEFLEFFNTLWLDRDQRLSPSLDYHIQILDEALMRHEFDVVKASSVPNQPIEKQVEHMIERSTEIMTKHAKVDAASFAGDWDTVLEVARDAENGIKPNSLYTGYSSLDAILGEGILDDYLWIVGADSGAGKTTFALNVIKNLALNNRVSTLFLSFEMGRERLMRWFMGACTGIPLRSFVEGDITEEGYRQIADLQCNKLNFNALDIVPADPELSNVVKVIKLHVKRNPNCKFIVLDHLHLMSWNKSIQATDVVSAITKTLKHLAIELGVPIMLLAQLKKPEAPIPGKPRREPVASDLKGSGSIITDADLITILQIDNTISRYGNNRLLNAFVLKNRGGRGDGSHSTLTHLAESGVIYE